jgi:hypothetical protein
MHKLLSAFSLTLVTVLSLTAQNVTKYVLTEHFTNSKCSVCASRNPAFYTLLSQNEAAVHHIAYHPSVPYSTCVFYLANPTENNQRTDFYGVSGTPRVALNGSLVPLASQLLPPATLSAQIGLTSPVYVEVSETATTVQVRVHTVGEKPAGNYVLYTAFAEKLINYNAPNGEQQHHDVFRDMLSDINGDAFELPVTGESIEYQYTKTENANWVTDQMYALAWVQNTQDKSVLNSGTRFDPEVSGSSEAPVGSLQIAPNPVTERLFAIVADDQPQSVEVFSMSGSLVRADYSLEGNQVSVDAAALIPGIYFLKVRGEKGTFTGKFVK